MNALFTVEECPDTVTPKGPELRHAKHKDYDDYSYEYDDNTFNVISLDPKKTKVQVRASRGQVSETRHHYIAAEEVTWNYAPHLKHTDR